LIATPDPKGSSVSNTILLSVLTVSGLVTVILLIYFYTSKQPTDEKRAKNRRDSLAVVAPADALLSDDQLDQIKLAKKADVLKNELQTYTPEEETTVKEGKMFYMRCKEQYGEMKELTNPDEHVEMKSRHFNGESVPTCVASTTIDTTVDEGAAHAIVHLDSRTTLRNADQDGKSQLKVVNINPHSLYYLLTMRPFIPGMASRTSRAIVSW
jgi:hypothetical protein